MQKNDINQIGRVQQTVGKTMTRFIRNLLKALSDPRIKDVICWSDDGNTFLILNYELFVSSILPRYF